MALADALDRGLSALASALRFGSGGRVGRIGPRPARPVELYEFEGCPFCRKVREALSILDLDAIVRPCPKRGTRYRPWVAERGGRAQFPYLVDPNRDVALYESDDIVRHLFTHYGDGQVPAALAAGPLTNLSVMSIGAARPARGAFCRPSKPPATPLELVGYEASPASRRVRERLCVLELPYLLHNRAHGSSRPWPRGVETLPALIDPNADVVVEGDTAILRHLDATYALG